MVCGPGGGTGDSEFFAEFSDLKTVQTHGGVEVLAKNLLGRLLGDLFNLDPPLAADHQDWHGSGSIQHDPEIEFPLDVAARFDDDLVDQGAFGAGLDGHQAVVQHILGDRGSFFGRFYQLNATLLFLADNRSLAASPCVDLGFDDCNSSP